MAAEKCKKLQKMVRVKPDSVQGQAGLIGGAN
jgi:hypothetical protein